LVSDAKCAHVGGLVITVSFNQFTSVFRIYWKTILSPETFYHA